MVVFIHLFPNYISDCNSWCIILGPLKCLVQFGSYYQGPTKSAFFFSFCLAIFTFWSMLTISDILCNLLYCCRRECRNFNAMMKQESHGSKYWNLVMLCFHQPVPQQTLRINGGTYAKEVQNRNEVVICM